MAISEAAKTLKALRQRAHFSVRKFAKAMDWDAGRLQHYEDRYKKPALPIELVVAAGNVLIGKGRPAITVEEVAALAGEEAEEAASAMVSGNQLVVGKMQHGEAKTASDPTAHVTSMTQTPNGYSTAPESVQLPDRRTWPRDIQVRALGSASVKGGSTLSGYTGEISPRPPGLTGLSLVFAIRNPDARMAPLWRVGARMYLTSAEVRPVAVGDHVMIETADEAGGPNICFIGRLSRHDDKGWHLIRYTPGSEQSIPLAAVRKVWRIFEWEELFGA